MKIFNKKNNKKKRFSLKTFCAFIIFEFLFTIITAPFILLYGPFERAKKVYVGAAMTTLSHQWLATTFLSQDKIDEILNSNRSKDIKDNNLETNKNIESTITLPIKKDDTMELFSFENFKYKGYYLVVNDPKRITVGYSKNLGKEGQTTSEMAKEFGAVAGINGGAFHDESSSSGDRKNQWNGNGGNPRGFIISDSKVIFNDVAKKEKSEVFAMTKEGKMLVGKYTLDELISKNVTDAVTFTPTLVKNGLPVKNLPDWGIAPRTAIGQRSDSAIVLMVIEGRSLSDMKAGASLEELQQLLIKYGHVVNGINLDGGRSSTLYLNGKVINKLSSNIGERALPSSILVK
ncbi:phosphodiester glycosidase family protein [Clostridium fallax]|uniref:Exopolysaccharide biosynthesis protein n=1 Tax=Clostridium fallax TaxID=1533 RepID=A0A1M4ZG43_9CLOT|nr:phosphodiester glycosidase family protein [Clostridium fallax]SHF17009.1 Exopolysaccharide biosynthesis protein [Clostridium fallax]SQB06387.1 exopolysaccharide biosynthesis protein [Clostridium fallax]